MVRPERVGDDGSVQLLAVPFVLVVLVLVLLVTACSSVSAEGDEEWDDVRTTEEGPVPGDGGGGIAEPEVTADGRMLQPAGHTGVWFETEPTDTLERLVYESQRYVGKPVVLEPIGERALLPQWEDMPDPCHPEVMRRMGELGLETVIDDDIGPGYAQCSVHTDEGANGEYIGFDWGTVVNVDDFSLTDSYVAKDDGQVNLIEQGRMYELMGCIAHLRGNVSKISMVSTVSDLSDYYGCNGSEFTLILTFNVLGGDVNVKV